MTKQQVLDLYFLDARHKLVELAAFLDRVERADGRGDFRLKSFRVALDKLAGNKKQKAKKCFARIQRSNDKTNCQSGGQRCNRGISSADLTDSRQ